MEAALGDMKRDIQALSECRTGLDRVQQTVRTSVFYQDVGDAEDLHNKFLCRTFIVKKQQEVN